MVRSLRANGICERFNKAIQQESSQVSSGMSCMSICKGAWQDPDERLMYYNESGARIGERPAVTAHRWTRWKMGKQIWEQNS